MARIFEPVSERKPADNEISLSFLNAHIANDYYKVHKEGVAVNDGKFIKYVDDREE